MSTEHPNDSAAPGAAGAGDLAGSIAQVVVSALGVGAALTRLLAETTSRGTPERRPAGNEPLSLIVHYGVETVRNIVGLVAASASSVRPPAGPGSAAADAAAPSPPGDAQPAPTPAARGLRPSVHQGASLRIPLSIENPGAQALGPITGICESVRHAGPSSLRPECLRFAPAVLTIQPRDFEKLTVHIDAPADAAPGVYIATIASTTAAFRMPIEFEVLPA